MMRSVSSGVLPEAVPPDSQARTVATKQQPAATQQHLSSWLEARGLAWYASTLVEQCFTVEDLQEMSPEDLRALCIEAAGGIDASWSVWLTQQGLGHYAPTLAENEFTDLEELKAMEPTHSYVLCVWSWAWQRWRRAPPSKAPCNWQV
jgi:hypothetical protein